MSELIQSSETDTHIIMCYNVSTDITFDNDYYMEAMNKATSIPYYSYFEDLEDMFYIYDLLTKVG